MFWSGLKYICWQVHKEVGKIKIWENDWNWRRKYESRSEREKMWDEKWSDRKKYERRFERENMHFLDPFSATALGSTHPSPPLCIVMFMKHWWGDEAENQEYKQVNWGNIMVWANWGHSAIMPSTHLGPARALYGTLSGISTNVTGFEWKLNVK